MRQKISLQVDSAAFCCSFMLIALFPNVVDEGGGPGGLGKGGEQAHIYHRFLNLLTFKVHCFVNCLL
jgi:hypothetical protein